MRAEARKPLYWIASSLKDLKAMPVPIQKVFGAGLRDVQYGDRPIAAKILSGFGSGGVQELVEDYDRGTFRAVYTVNFPGAVYVLHVFQKKSRRGIRTAREDLELIRNRLAQARIHHEASRQRRES